MVKKLCGVTVLAVLLAATPARAQIPGIDLEPYIGVFLPFTNLVDQVIESVDIKASQKEALVVGGRLTVWLTGPLGVEGNVLYAFSDGKFEDPDGTQEEGANVWSADARLIWKLLPGPIGVHLDGGVALIGRGGDFYDEVTEGKTNVGGVVGLGLRVKLPAILAIRADADAYLYSAELTVDSPDLGPQPVTLDSQFQADVVISAGLVISLM